VIILLVIYALLPETMRFSRAIILSGAAWGIPVLILHRIIPSLFKSEDYELAAQKKRKNIIIGKRDEADRTAGILQITNPETEITGYVSSLNNPETGTPFIGTADQLRDIVLINKIDEIIFCSRDISSKEIISYMSLLSGLKVDFKIAPPESISIIGSNSIKTSDDLFLVSFNSVSKEVNRRNKRLFDILSSLIIIIVSPAFFLIFKSYSKIFTSAFRVISGNYTWVGYCTLSDISVFPQLKKPVFTLSSGLSTVPDKAGSEKLNILYARDYNVLRDFQVLWRNLIKKQH